MSTKRKTHENVAPSIQYTEKGVVIDGKSYVAEALFEKLRETVQRQNEIIEDYDHLASELIDAHMNATEIIDKMEFLRDRSEDSK